MEPNGRYRLKDVKRRFQKHCKRKVQHTCGDHVDVQVDGVDQSPWRRIRVEECDARRQLRLLESVSDTRLIFALRSGACRWVRLILYGLPEQTAALTPHLLVQPPALLSSWHLLTTF